MKERLMQLLDLEQLTPSKFADIIGVQRSSVSHVISGRNNPSFDFLQKTLRAFPGLNAEWLMLGKGTMYDQMGRTTSGTLFDTPVKQDEPVRNEPADQGEPVDEAVRQEVPGEETYTIKELQDLTEDEDNKDVTNWISKVVLLYSDGTFSSFEPS